MMRFLFSATVFGLTALVGGCGSTSSPESEGEPQLGAVRQLADAENVTLPLDAYLATPEQNATIDTARDILVRDCMKRFGFDWQVQERPVTPQPGRRYGISNAADVARYGYHLAPERTGPEKPEVDSLAKPAADEQMVARGAGQSSYNGLRIPEGGCLAEADRALGFEVTVHVGGGNERKDLVLKLNAVVRQGFEGDSRLAVVYVKWSACMHDRGYDYKNPWAANNDPAMRVETASAKEIATAQADLACRNQHNVAGVSLAIETAHQARVIEKNTDALRSEKQKLDERVKKAGDLVSGVR
jgi:hypothetical protein